MNEQTPAIHAGVHLIIGAARHEFLPGIQIPVKLLCVKGLGTPSRYCRGDCVEVAATCTACPAGVGVG
ncbi:MAG: hypothetical protein MZV64_23220 [Ignavibacteriales bacterium]|nr:hypothetical protein [Ignavibacteriales bacterium]